MQCPRLQYRERSTEMSDLIYLALVVILFVLGALYTRACERL